MSEANGKIPTSPEQLPQLLLNSQLCFPLYAASRKVVNRYTPYFKQLGITYTQYIVFLVLWEAGSATVGDLCRRLYLDNGTITPLLKKMEGSGFITRSRSKQDERVVTLQLTEAGWNLRQKVREIPGLVGSCIPLTAEEAATLYGILYKILNEME
ncbi:MAG: MarR family transcriptional regulator [Clostridia bacterium]|nr:MarR family transcriptional regulator [Clostridia bacterium]